MSEIKDAAQSFESSLMILRKDKNGWVIVFSVHPNEAPQSLLTAPLGTRFQVVLFQIDDDESFVIPEDVRRGKKAVAIAGQLCREDSFQSWIGSKYAPQIGDSVGESECVVILRGMLDIESRSELEFNTEAQDEFRSLIEKFREETKDERH